MSFKAGDRIKCPDYDRFEHVSSYGTVIRVIGCIAQCKMDFYAYNGADSDNYQKSPTECHSIDFQNIRHATKLEQALK